MSAAAANRRFRCVVAGLGVALALGLASCGSEPDDDGAAAGNPGSELTAEEAAKPLADAPPELAAIRAQANEILGGGLDAFEARLAELEGTPVVVNKWASWCGPCREEFPYFQAQAAERGDEIAFLGLNSRDGEDTARTFLAQLPLPFPSYFDPDAELAESLSAAREFPTTVFIGADGKPAYVKRGPYLSEDELAADIERYAG